MQTYHPDKHVEYLSEEKSRRHRRENTSGLKLTQKEFEDTLVDLIVEGMLPVSFVKLPAFNRYTQSNFFSRFYSFFEINFS